MTENEKAAIAGKIWEPYTCDMGRCDFCGAGASLPSHPAVAPDMSRPENFWRALMELSKYGDWSVGREGASLGPFWMDRKQFGPFIVSARHAGGEGKAIVQALAALYDKEHPDAAA